MSGNSQEVIVIGGGVIGLSVGWYLSRAGFQVTILDRDSSGRESCSDQNAGMVVPSHFIPLAAPGVIGQGLKWMLNPKSPFYLRPRLDLEMWRWCWDFFRSSNKRNVLKYRQLLADMSLQSRRLILEMGEELDVNIVQRGLVMYCQSRKGLEDETAVADMARLVGVEAEVCGRERIRELDPDVRMDVIGGVWFPQDCHLNPGMLLDALRKDISSRGGRFMDAEAVRFIREGRRVTRVVTKAEDELHVDQIVLACGAWTPDLAREFGLRLPMQGGKGYSMTLQNPVEQPRVCSLLKEGRVAVTPMGEKLRVAGTMEICGRDLSVNPLRVQGIIESFCQFFPAFKPEHFDGIDTWSGLRPCTPDGMPYIGPLPNTDNAIVATGHSMLGLSLGPVTGKIIARQLGVKDDGPALEVGLLAPQRFG